MNLAALPALTVAGPLAVAGLMLATSRVLPRRVPDIIAIAVALAAALSAAIMAHATAHAPLVTWFGGWTPRHEANHVQVIGISFVVGQAGAGFACFIALLFAATLVFAWGFFDEVHAHFHVLMLLFMAGMIGFCLTHDLFNLFVWFEVMSVAAFALTGYALRTDALEGALNFTVVNTVGSYFILGGIGLVYIRLGALDFAALHRGVAADPNDPVVTASFALLAAGLLTKGAQVPFQFWLADAHGVAPSPVSVIFSGAMVSIGLYGVATLVWAVYAPSPHVMHIVHTLLLGMGAASAVLGGVMALMQRHIKRLLAFSTISHAGIMLVGIALLNQDGLSGMLVYAVGHGLVKGATFMVAGILLATCGGIDEIGLRGRGRHVWPAGIAMVVGGLLLAGLPVGLMDAGFERIDAAAHQAGCRWVVAAAFMGSFLTGAAVLRVAGRVFAGFGPTPGEEDRSPTDEEQERSDRPLWLMLAPTALLLLLALPAADAAGTFASTAAASFIHPDTDAILGLAAPYVGMSSPTPAPGHSILPWPSVLLAVLIAAAELTRGRMPRALTAGYDRLAAPVTDGLRALQSGLIGDYVAWIVVGLALFSVTAAAS